MHLETEPYFMEPVFAWSLPFCSNFQEVPFFHLGVENDTFVEFAEVPVGGPNPKSVILSCENRQMFKLMSQDKEYIDFELRPISPEMRNALKC